MEEIEPVGFGRLEFMLGQLTALIANLFRKRGSRAYKAEDAIPWIEQPQRVQSIEEQKSILGIALAAARKNGNHGTGRHTGNRRHGKHPRSDEGISIYPQ